MISVSLPRCFSLYDLLHNFHSMPLNPPHNIPHNFTNSAAHTCTLFNFSAIAVLHNLRFFYRTCLWFEFISIMSRNVQFIWLINWYGKKVLIIFQFVEKGTFFEGTLNGNTIRLSSYIPRYTGNYTITVHRLSLPVHRASIIIIFTFFRRN
jgi:hypothetical protein